MIYRNLGWHTGNYVTYQPHATEKKAAQAQPDKCRLVGNLFKGKARFNATDAWYSCQMIYEKPFVASQVDCNNT